MNSEVTALSNAGVSALPFHQLPSLRVSFWLALIALVLAALCVRPVYAAQGDAEVRQVAKLLDYLAVDYSGAVADGAVISESEFAEMEEFSSTIHAQLLVLPEHQARQNLLDQAATLQAAITAFAEPVDVARIAHNLADSLLAAYPVAVAPKQAPDLAHGVAVYKQSCASCHGVEGRGDGIAAANLDPPPIAFTDRVRARERSLYSLYEVVSQGLADTSMVSFENTLSDDERWAVTFYISTLAGTANLSTEGEKIWRDDATVRARIPNMETFARTLESALAESIGADKASAVMAYLRTNPQALEQKNANDGLALARSALSESVKAYQSGDAKRAATLALSAYLDGFEPVEAMLRSHDANLLAQVESAMVVYRSSINKGADAATVSAQADALKVLFDATDQVLASEQDGLATFLGAFTILLREGIEALLVVVAMITFLGRVERRDVLPYVHAGWIGALVAGAITWAIAAYMVDISGANRELTEGISSVFAAVVLLAVGIWMHQKSLAGRWQIYLKEKLSAALTKKSAFFLFALAFVSVYREVFETILFYIALWTRGNGSSIFAGLIAGIIGLAIIAFILLRTSKRLPITKFFAASSFLIALLALVLAGKGFSALQEAGVVSAIAVHAPRIETLGIFPSLWPLLAQTVVLVVVIAAYLFNTRKLPAEAK